MIALDTNILIHLLVKSQREHERAGKWLAQVREPLSTTLTNIAETLRLLTHTKVFPSPLTLNKAVDLLELFIEQYQISILEESAEWWLELRDLASDNPSLKGNEIHDARIALALRYNGVKELCTLDANFSKYRFLTMISI